jgi:hypothetical protein
VTSLALAGHDNEALQLLCATAAACAEHQMVRFLLDEGTPVRALIATLRRESQANRWQSQWAPVPASFLDESLGPKSVERCPADPVALFPTHQDQ